MVTRRELVPAKLSTMGLLQMAALVVAVAVGQRRKGEEAVAALSIEHCWEASSQENSENGNYPSKMRGVY